MYIDSSHSPQSDRPLPLPTRTYLRRGRARQALRAQAMVPADAACVTRGPPRHCSATLLAPGTRASCLFLRLSSLGQAKVTVARASWDNPPERQTRVPQGGAFRYQEETLELPAW